MNSRKAQLLAAFACAAIAVALAIWIKDRVSRADPSTVGGLMAETMIPGSIMQAIQVAPARRLEALTANVASGIFSITIAGEMRAQEGNPVRPRDLERLSAAFLDESSRQIAEYLKKEAAAEAVRATAPVFATELSSAYRAGGTQSGLCEAAKLLRTRVYGVPSPTNAPCSEIEAATRQQVEAAKQILEVSGF